MGILRRATASIASHRRPRASKRRKRMKLFAFLVALASVAVAGADASAFLATDKNFDSAVMNSGKHVFVKYLAPW